MFLFIFLFVTIVACIYIYILYGNSTFDAQALRARGEKSTDRAQRVPVCERLPSFIFLLSVIGSGGWQAVRRRSGRPCGAYCAAPLVGFEAPL